MKVQLSGVINSDNRVYKKRRLVNKIMMIVSGFTVIFGLFWLAWILWTLISHGGAIVDLGLYTEITPPPDDVAGGLANAIVGSLIIVLLGTLIGTPIGVLAGTYLAEYGRNSRFTRATRFINDMLLSTPSIIIGLFVYTIYVARVGHFSGLAGAFALAVIIIPVIVRTTDNMLGLVPNSLREAAAALGCPSWKMITLITYRAAKTGIMTGLLLGIARISGETAPLLFTALNNQFWSLDVTQPMASLPVIMYKFAQTPHENWQRLAWGGALLITLAVLALNILAKTVFSNKKNG